MKGRPKHHALNHTVLANYPNLINPLHHFPDSLPNMRGKNNDKPTASGQTTTQPHNMLP
jgi:hypothetical protein